MAYGDATMRAVQPDRRELLLSFCGCARNMPLRRRILALHNGTDRVCIDATLQRSRLQTEAEAATGVRVPPQTDDQYVSLHARSKFSLCPRGDAVYSFRMVEAISCGAIPVIYGDGWVLPFSELLDYHDFAVIIAEADAESTPGILAAIGPAQLAQMQRCGREAFERLIGTIPQQLHAVLTILATRREASSQAAHIELPVNLAKYQVCGADLQREGIQRRAAREGAAVNTARERTTAVVAALPSRPARDCVHGRHGGSQRGVEVSAWRTRPPHSSPQKSETPAAAK